MQTTTTTQNASFSSNFQSDVETPSTSQIRRPPQPISAWPFPPFPLPSLILEPLCQKGGRREPHGCSPPYQQIQRVSPDAPAKHPEVVQDPAEEEDENSEEEEEDEEDENSHPLDIADSQSMTDDEANAVLTSLLHKPCRNAVAYLFDFQRPNPAQLEKQYDVLDLVGRHISKWSLAKAVPLQMSAPYSRNGKTRVSLASLTPDEQAQANLAAVLKVAPGRLNVLRLIDLLLQGLVDLRFEKWDRIENGHQTNQGMARLSWAKHYGPKLSTRMYNTEDRQADEVFQTAQAKTDYMHFAECFRHVVETLSNSSYLCELDVDAALKDEKSRTDIFQTISALFLRKVEPIHVLFKAMTVSFNGFVPTAVSSVIGKSNNNASKQRGFFYNHILNGRLEYEENNRKFWKLTWYKGTYFITGQSKPHTKRTSSPTPGPSQTSAKKSSKKSLPEPPPPQQQTTTTAMIHQEPSPSPPPPS